MDMDWVMEDMEWVMEDMDPGIDQRMEDTKEDIIIQ